jgi:hypothetical protein
MGQLLGCTRIWLRMTPAWLGTCLVPDLAQPCRSSIRGLKVGGPLWSGCGRCAQRVLVVGVLRNYLLGVVISCIGAEIASNPGSWGRRSVSSAQPWPHNFCRSNARFNPQAG